MQFAHPRAFNHPPQYMDYLTPAYLPSRFATSSERASAPPTVTSPPTHTARYDPLGVLEEDPAIAARKAVFAQFMPRFAAHEVSRGVLSDGTWTAQHPAVLRFLRNPRPASPSCARLYALAALHVIYSPSHPAYEWFWNPEDRRNTADFIDGLLRMPNSPISTAPLTWLGVHEMVWQLTGLQKDYAKHQARELGVPLQSIVRRMSLRKRKPVQDALREQSLGISEISEPPRKRARTSRAKPDDAEEKPQPQPHAKEQAEEPTAPRRGARMVLHGSSPLSTPSPAGSVVPLPSVEDSAAAQPSRGRSTRTRVKSKKALAAEEGDDRERSPSSGSSTATSTTVRARSSSSASSTVTTVDPNAGKDKDKGKALDAAIVQVDDGDFHMEEEAVPARTTRARTRAAVKGSGTPAPEVEEDDVDEEKEVEEKEKEVVAKKQARSGASRPRTRKTRRR